MYKLIKNFVKTQSDKWARERLSFFIKKMNLQEGTTVLDLGGYNGRFFYDFRDLIQHLNLNIIIADIDKNALAVAESRGFKALCLDGSGLINLPDKSVDIVFCNSVIEHVTGEKSKTCSYIKDDEFKKIAWDNQLLFANEIRRIGKGYFVQTPHVDFPIESHTWLPLITKLKRKKLIKLFGFQLNEWN